MDHKTVKITLLLLIILTTLFGNKALMRNLLTALAILLVGSALSFMIGTMKPKPEKRPDSEQSAISVSYILASDQAQQVSVEVHGHVEASHSIELIAEVSGRILNVHKHFIAGGRIPKNQSIASIDNTQYIANLANAEAELANAEEALSTIEAQAVQARKEWRDLGSEQANNLFLRKPQLKSAKSSLKTAQARLNVAKQQLQRTKVQLPYSSNIIETFIHEGQYVSQGTKLASVYRSDKRQIKLQVSQQQLDKAGIGWPIDIHKHNTIRIRDPRSQGIEIDGKLISHSATVNRNNQLIDLIVDIDSQYADHFLPGLYVQASIAGEAQSNIQRIPEDAFHDKRFLLIINDQQKVTFIPASFVGRDGEQVLVKSAVKAGDKIISSRIALATPGMKVNPIKAEIKPPPSTENPQP